MKSVLRIALAVAISVFALAGPASAQNYTSQGSVNLSGPMRAGETITVSGEAPGTSNVVVKIDGAAVGSYTVPQTAAEMVQYSFQATLPANLAVGNRMLTVEVDGVQVSSTTLVIAAAQAGNSNAQTGQTGQLATTGSDSTPLAAVAFGLIGAGALALLARRRMAAA